MIIRQQTNVIVRVILPGLLYKLNVCFGLASAIQSFGTNINICDTFTVNTLHLIFEYPIVNVNEVNAVKHPIILSVIVTICSEKMFFVKSNDLLL